MESTLEIQKTKLKRQMAKHALAPSGPILSDGQRHEYVINHNGRQRQAEYVAYAYPFYDISEEPILICWYGFPDEKFYEYSSQKL